MSAARLTQFQDGFRHLVSAADTCCAERFGDRLEGAYVAGSVAVGEAWPGASDLDWFAFLRDDLTPADRAWQARARRRLEREFPVADEVHLNVLPLDRLRQEAFWRFILRYNAVRVRGRNLIAELARNGVRTARPSRKLAKSRLPFVRTCLDEALAGRCPPSLGALPRDPFLATRKLARNFMLVEGAYALMARGAFTSFRQEAVLPGLRHAWPRWRSLARTARLVLDNPYRAAVAPDDFMRRVHPFVTWAIDLIQSA